MRCQCGDMVMVEREIVNARKRGLTRLCCAAGSPTNSPCGPVLNNGLPVCPRRGCHPLGRRCRRVVGWAGHLRCRVDENGDTHGCEKCVSNGLIRDRFSPSTLWWLFAFGLQVERRGGRGAGRIVSQASRDARRRLIIKRGVICASRDDACQCGLCARYVRRWALFITSSTYARAPLVVALPHVHTLVRVQVGFHSVREPTTTPNWTTPPTLDVSADGEEMARAASSPQAASAPAFFNQDSEDDETR